MNLKEAGYGQENTVEDIVIRLFAEFQNQANMVESNPPEDLKPPIAGMAELLQQVLDQNQELMQLLSAKDVKSVRKNTSRYPTPSTAPRQEQPRQPMPAYFDK